MQIEVLAKPVS